MKISHFLSKKYHIDINIYAVLFVLYNLLAFNNVFFRNIFALTQSPIFVIVTFTLLALLLMLCAVILFYKSSVKPLSYALLIINSGIYYFINTYHIAINEEMLVNVMQTNLMEGLDLINGTFCLYILVYAILPIIIIRRLIIDTKNFCKRKTVFIISYSALLAILILPLASTIFPFIHEHKPLKYLLTPVNYISAVISYTKHTYRDHREFQSIGQDAHHTKYWKNNKNMLIVFVLGETARAQNFSFNGYERDTNAPLNKYRDNIINYSQATSCGTSTAISVPCMFSKDSRSDFHRGSAEYTENVLDILQKNSYHAVWFENNSDCKDVCNRVEQVFPCPYLIGTCTDDVMLLHLKEKIMESSGNKIIVLHQIGSHGPKYYARYPEKSAEYKPTCQTEEINSCTNEELLNTYDNSISYTSQNIADTIKKLKKLENEYNIILFYVSDHGESLGERGFYLHSAPYSIAPQEQIHIPFFIWAEDKTWHDLQIDKKCMKNHQNEPISHDNIFHSLLGISGINSGEYDKDLDLFHPCRK